MDFRVIELMFYAYHPALTERRENKLKLAKMYKKVIRQLTDRWWDNIFSGEIEPNIPTRDEVKKLIGI